MRWLHRARAKHSGLGLLWTADGLALSQSQCRDTTSHLAPTWHWQPKPGSSLRACLPQEPWPDPHQLKLARQRSGFQAQAIAMALPESQLQRWRIQLEPGLSPKQIHSHIATQLQQRLPTPLAETVWDFRLCLETASAPVATRPGPAWLLAALQAQALQTWDVLAAPRAWVLTAQQCCRAAGLTLVRLEPDWQAAQRWQAWLSQRPAMDETSHAKAQACTPLSAEQQAVLRGLALGVVDT
ncbi:MAG: hypothetical protein EBZ60_03860 [Betaproteobacteria bacterium]|nr:hypothetical protein [Betaproteobacteria bacterium]